MADDFDLLDFGLHASKGEESNKGNGGYKCNECEGFGGDNFKTNDGDADDPYFHQSNYEQSNDKRILRACGT